ncbi:MAG: Hpt domain-containing protein [Rhodospirillales bacterium]
MIPDRPSGLVDAGMINDVRRNVSAGAAASLYEGFFAEVRNHGLPCPDSQPVDMARMADRAHSLKSTCGTFGLVGLAAIAREIELCCGSGDSDRAVELAGEFQAIAEASIREAQAVLDSDGG